MSQTQAFPVPPLPEDFRVAVAKYVRELVDEHHNNIPEEPLRLAFYFFTDNQPSIVDVFEVIENFGGNRISQLSELFVVTQEGPVAPYSSFSPTIRLILTNPNEVPVAFRDHWVGTAPVRDAVQAGTFTIIRGDPQDPLLDVIRGQ